MKNEGKLWKIRKPMENQRKTNESQRKAEENQRTNILGRFWTSLGGPKEMSGDAYNSSNKSLGKRVANKRVTNRPWTMLSPTNWFAEGLGECSRYTRSKKV